MEGRSHDHVLAAGWLSGSAILASRAALQEIGLLDDRFFMYCEDMDLCRRAHGAGWGVYYNPTARIVHLRSRSTDQRVAAMLLQHHLSMWKYYDKHERSLQPAWWTAGVAAVIAGRAVVIVVGHYVLRMMKFFRGIEDRRRARLRERRAQR